MSLTVTPQDLQFTLMRMASFNNFDGGYVADSLAANSELWEAWILDRESYGAAYAMDQVRRAVEKGEEPNKRFAKVTPIDLIRLRDLAAGYWNVDALYVLPVKGKEKDLELLARRDWGADEIDWVSGQDAGTEVLRVWWD
jgi:hypothetical protein